MNKTEKKEYKVVMDLLAEKIKIQPDLCNVNGLFRKLFSVEYSNLRGDDEENLSTKETKVFIKLKKGKKIYHLPIEDFEMDMHDGDMVLEAFVPPCGLQGYPFNWPSCGMQGP